MLFFKNVAKNVTQNDEKNLSRINVSKSQTTEIWWQTIKFVKFWGAYCQAYQCATSPTNNYTALIHSILVLIYEGTPFYKSTWANDDLLQQMVLCFICHMILSRWPFELLKWRVFCQRSHYGSSRQTSRLIIDSATVGLLDERSAHAKWLHGLSK